MSKDRVYTILFENCETATIPESAVYSFTADDVTEGYRGSARNGVYSYKEANRVQMAIELDYLKNTSVPKCMFQDENSSLEDRLSWGDIVSVETPDRVEIHVPWKEYEDHDEQQNGTQKTEVVDAWLEPDKDGEYLSISFSYGKDSNEEDEDTDDCSSSEDDNKIKGIKPTDGICLLSEGKSIPLQYVIEGINLSINSLSSKVSALSSENKRSLDAINSRINSIEAKTDSNTTNTVYAYKLKSRGKDSLIRVINELDHLTSALSEWVNNCD